VPQPKDESKIFIYDQHGFELHRYAAHAPSIQITQYNQHSAGQTLTALVSCGARETALEE
jgi:hypothetical protein